jgi:hypothetical protein
MRRVPAIGLGLVQFQSQVAELINKTHVFTSAPSLEEMEIGEMALGDGTESSPAAGSDALYFRPDSSKIVVISSNGSTLATRNIT